MKFSIIFGLQYRNITDQTLKIFDLEIKSYLRWVNAAVRANKFKNSMMTVVNKVRT